MHQIDLLRTSHPCTRRTTQAKVEMQVDECSYKVIRSTQLWAAALPYAEPCFGRPMPSFDWVRASPRTRGAKEI